jgi:DHA1 family tetracycline resistance protein-like MFS transporter
VTGGPADGPLSPLVLRRRYLVLRGLRWLPVGLVIPVLVLLLLDRGLSLGQIGFVTAAQGVAVMLLELPTGGLADAIGRRRVLLIASGFQITATTLLLASGAPLVAAAAFGLQGVYRALESGPLDAWYVDAAQAADPDADIEGGLAAGGVVVGIAIAAGSLLSSAVVAADLLPGVGSLATPLLVALGLQLVEVVAIARLMVEPHPPGVDADAADVRAMLATVPAVVGAAVRTVRRSRVLLALVTIELLWGLGMVAFETFTPPRLEAVTGSADTAATLLGPTNAAAWLLSAAGAAAVPALTRRIGAHRSGTALLAIQAAGVVAIALLGGPAGVIGAFTVVMIVHGAANPVHQGLLHRAVTDARQRATVASANSLTASIGGAVGGIALGALADATTLSTAILAGAAALALAAPLYRRTTPAHPLMTVRHRKITATAKAVRGPADQRRAPATDRTAASDPTDG